MPNFTITRQTLKFLLQKLESIGNSNMSYNYAIQSHDDLLKFCSDSSESSILYELSYTLRTYADNEYPPASVAKILEVGDYFNVEGKMITYTPKGRPHDGWEGKNRQKMRPGRFAKLAFPNSTFSDVDIEKFTFCFADHKVEYLKGAEIADVYMMDKVPDSCMCFSEGEREWVNRGFFDIYTKNPDQVSMAVIRKNHNHVVARAILYVTTKGEKIYTRTYGLQNKLASLLEADGYRLWDEEDEVKLDNWEFAQYPYLDSLQSLDMDLGIINYGKGNFLDSTRGGNGTIPDDELEEDYAEETY